MVERIVRGGSRRSRHQALRSLFLGFLCCTAGITLLLTASLGGTVSMRTLATAGAAVFEFTAMAQIAAICLITPIVMAGAIDQEASPRTWDLLRTTPLSSVGIVLGSLLGRLFFVLALIAAGLPILLIIRAFGGVSTVAVLQSSAIAACTATVVATAAVMLSATRSGGRRGVLVYFAAIALALSATWAGNAALRTPIPGSLGAMTTTVVTPLNPFLVLDVVLHPARSVSALAAGGLAVEGHAQGSGFGTFWFGHPLGAFAAMSGVTTACMLGWSVLRVRVLGPVLGRRRDSESSRPRTPRTVGSNPIAWRASAGRPRGRWDAVTRWSWAAVMTLGIIILLATLLGGQTSLETGRTILRAGLLVQLAVLTLAVSAAAAAAIARDRADGTLDLLLTTPIQPKPYLRGKLLGICLLASPFMTALLATLLITAAAVAGSAHGSLLVPPTGDSAAAPLATWGGLIGAACCMVPFAGWCTAVGLSWSMRSRLTVKATLTAVTINIAAAGLLVPCLWSGGLAWFLAPLMMACPATAIMVATADGHFLSNWPMAEVGRQWMLLGCGVAGGLFWSLLTAMLLQTTGRAFVPTMRRLAGT